MTVPANSTTSYRLGCDTGGTFTDFVLLDADTGRVWVEKVLTTPDDPARGVFQGVDYLRRTLPTYPEQTSTVIYGTTLVINALIERKGARTALITTRGFRDVLELRRANRGDLWDLSGRVPEPIIPRRDRYEVDERLWADGSVHIPLDRAQVEALASDLQEQGYEAVAVCLLHSYANAEHEQAVRDALKAAAPDLRVSISSDVLPEIKEYERTVATAVNAYVQPVVSRYLPALKSGLDERGVSGTLRMLMSEGSVVSTDTAATFPVRIIESGPVGGVLAAHLLAESLGVSQAIAYDMGGTTAKTTLIKDGAIPITWDHEIARTYRFKPGSGLPLGTPTVDILEIGAGGGSIAQVNQMGLLQIGPRSAGASPGPACYGKGGTEPTVTDADLLLGCLDPAYFLGGRMPISVEAAQKAIREHVAEPLGVSVEEAAWRIVDLANETMSSAIQLQIAHQGGEAAEFSLIAYGGAGPVHAFAVAEKLGLRHIVVPRGAGVMSAFGFIAAPTAFRLAQTYRRALADCDPVELDRVFGGLVQRALDLAGQDTIGPNYVTKRWARMRYLGQGYEIRVPLGEDHDDIARHFDRQYARLYGRSYPDQPLEMVALEVTVSGIPPQIGWAAPREARQSGREARKGDRQLYQPAIGGKANCAVYDRYALAPGTTVDGPAVFEERESTLVVGPDAQVTVDDYGNLVIAR